MMPAEEHASGRGRGTTRSDIIRAAMRCFMQRGYNKTTMDQIVAESGLSKGTLYWYFDSKESLFEAALLSVFEGFGDDLIAMLDRCETATEKLHCLSQGAAAFSDSVGGYFSLFLEFWGSTSHPDEANQVWYDLLEEYQAILSAIVEEGVASGEFQPVDAESLIWALMATYDGLAAYAGFIPDLDLQRISQTFTDIVLNGLTRDADETGPSGGA